MLWFTFAPTGRALCAECFGAVVSRYNAKTSSAQVTAIWSGCNTWPAV
ncbi:hypothetical protein FHT08_003332 [Xanthomonas campestris]|nr:hypothetical protein [Xanthomonas sp. CFBP 8151]NIJ78212.1 hypothetical protein [Xanthomonas sp. CFBP 8151]